MRVLAAAAVALALAAAAAGLASARLIEGTSRSESLRGTNGPDTILGRGGKDRIGGRAGADVLDGGPGRDVVLGGRGSDRVAVASDGARDRVACGAGRDVVNADRVDRVARDCEIVSRALSRDPLRRTGAQHETQVEPDSLAWGATIVTAFQSGRYDDGAAARIGWATSKDGGRTWRSGFLPALTVHSRPRGRHARASDPAVAYDAAHRVWLIATLAVSPSVTELLVSRSRDGVRWSRPVVASSEVPHGEEKIAFDKEWIACDSWPRSPFRGRCYLAYTHTGGGNRLATQTSRDGGRTWSAAVTAAPPAVVGAFPVVRPNGDLLVVHSDWQAVAVARSTDGGATFRAPVRVATHPGRRLRTFRAFHLPSADVDRDGNVYVAWHDCRFRPGCDATDIVLSTSRDGVAWSAPARVPLGPVSSARGHLIPGLSVDPRTGGRRARLAIAYYSLSNGACEPSCTVDAGLIVSRSGGRGWGRPQRLNARPMRLDWVADTFLGRMLADYVSTSWSRGRPIAVVAIASEPHGGVFRQAIFATQPRYAAISAAPSAGQSASRRCSKWAVPARIAGKAVCLRDERRCNRRLAVQYRRYGFNCLHGTLATRWEVLRSRPLTDRRMSPGEPCPVTTETARVGQYEGLGPGPAYPIGTGAVITMRMPPPEGWGFEWSGTKRVWLLDSRYAGRALVRGRQLDGPNEVRFVLGVPGFTPKKLLNPVREQRIVGTSPSLTRLRAPGCYAYQVDTRTRSYLVIFEARLAG